MSHATLRCNTLLKSNITLIGPRAHTKNTLSARIFKLEKAKRRKIRKQRGLKNGF